MKIKNKNEIKNWISGVESISQDEVKFLHCNDYRDGPLEGVMELKGKKYYFLACDGDEEAENGGVRSYAVIEMSKDQQDKEDYFHDLFVSHVGSHFEYDKSGKLMPDKELKDKTEQDKFYSEYARSEGFLIEKSQVKAKF